MAGCRSPEENKARHLERVNHYFNEKRFSEAIIEYRNVIKINPRHGEAFHKLGYCYLKTGKGKEAFDSLSNAVSLDPDNLQAQITLGALYLLGKSPAEARADGMADLIWVGHSMLADPAWARKTIDGKPESINLCRECKSCFHFTDASKYPACIKTIMPIHS